MLFNSALFIISFTLFYFIYYLLGNKILLRNILLLIFGCIFYYSLSPLAPIGLFILGTLDFLTGKAIAGSTSPSKKKLFLFSAILYHLALLTLYRYVPYSFSADWFPLWFKWIGLSYLVFRSLGYVLDLYFERLEDSEKSWLNYMVYLSYFPLIISGPIATARDFLPQLKKRFEISSESVSTAMYLLISGILKKYMLSQFLSANFVDRVFESHEFFTGMEQLLASFFQCLVIYLDFSGYTDLMMGISLLLGIQLPDNFRFPYISQNITEYWRRWHLTLSSWLNENLYFPLSFTLRKWKKLGTIIAVYVTFTLSGIWHGVGLHYLLWGLTHACALTWDILSTKFRNALKKVIPMMVYKPFSIALTFLFLSLSGIYFKAGSIEKAHQMMYKIFLFDGWELYTQWFQNYFRVAIVGFAALILHWIPESAYLQLKNIFLKIPLIFQSLLLALTIFLAYQITSGEALPFIYLQY